MQRIYFTDFFSVPRPTLEEYGAFNVSLITDLPLFIDPFLLFNSTNSRYKELHDEIIEYLRFLRDKSAAGTINPGLIRAWFMFSEVKQTWLGFTAHGNEGLGLGNKFASALDHNLATIFANFGQEKVTVGSHLEKLCLIQDGVGRDMISDFTTNLIKHFLLEYTQAFAQQHLQPAQRRVVSVPKARFNYTTESWESLQYELPWYGGDYVLLTPKDILTKDQTWISRPDFINELEDVAESMPNEALRGLVNNYFASCLSKDPTPKDRRAAATATISKFPELIEYFIRYKEDHGDEATVESRMKVAEAQELFIQKVTELVALLQSNTAFYQTPGNTLDEARQRIEFLRHVIEDQDGYKLFYQDKVPVKNEKFLQIISRFIWFGTPSDVTSEADDGRGPVDFKISRGAKDKSLVEFKLASNTQLKRNLANQVPVYEKAAGSWQSLKVVLYFTDFERARVIKILEELKIKDSRDIILIDARADNKPSGSKA
jgi:hypothetical protein